MLIKKVKSIQIFTERLGITQALIEACTFFGLAIGDQAACPQYNTIQYKTNTYCIVPQYHLQNEISTGNILILADWDFLKVFKEP